MTTMISLWRNDASRQLEARAEHLLEKAGVDQWLWAVGDSSDETEALLSRIVTGRGDVLVARCNTGIVGADAETSRRRSGETFSAALMRLDPREKTVVLHESDLRSPVDVVAQLGQSGLSPIAGWPIIKLASGEAFYDIWAYRGLDNVHFAQYAPFHQDYSSRVFEVGSFGSCWMAPAALLQNRWVSDEACVGLCRQWRSEGICLWVDPTVRIEQPVELWSPA
jgi:hypothetical protein